VPTPLLTLLSGLLSPVLEADHAAVRARRALEVVQVESETDGLTTLLNRRGWDRYIEVEEERFRRFGDQASVIAMDLDRLKIINDTQGHDAGDRYLQRTGEVLKASVRSGDVVARLGGDEFGVIVVGAGSDTAARLVGRMSAALEKAGISGSFGHAPITVVAGFLGAWEAADSVMYDEKRRRRSERTNPSPS
jgi:diguanylate cyclase (GGDEF)-like protein